MGWLSKLFDPGKGSRDAAGRAGEAGVIKGFNFSGPGGIGGGFNFNKGIGSASTSLGAFENPFQQLIASGMAGTSGAGMDALTGTAGAVTDRLGQPLNVQQMSGQGDYDMLGGLMSNAAGIAQKDPFELGATISDKLRALSERKNQRTANRFFDRLKSTGNLTSSAGMQQAYEMQAQQDELGLQQDLAGLQFGQGMIRDAFGQVMGAGQAREGIAGRTFGEGMAMEQMQGQRAMDQWGVQSGLFGMGLQGQGMGLNQLQMAMGMQQLPMQQLAQMAGLTGLASGSNFNLAGIHQGNASMAKSPWLEALNAVGTFAGNIGVNVGGE